MKIIKSAALLLMCAVISAKSMAQTDNKEQNKEQTKEQLVIPLSDPGKPYKLDMNITNGSISVVGYEGKDIVIEVQTKGDRKKDNGKEASSGMRRITGGNAVDLTANERNNRVTVSTDSWRNAVISIKVPQTGASLKLGTVNGGDINVSNVSGELEISNTNGAIHLSGIAGSAVANTTNGSVTATFKTIDPKAPMAFTTLNGNVDVSFPATLKTNLKMKSDRGEMYTDFDMEADKSQPKVSKTHEGSMYRLNIEDWVYGKIGGGGPEMLMKTMNGNIYIRKAK